MRILCVVPRYWPSMGGAQLVSRELIHRMSHRHAVRVVTQFTSDGDSYILSVTSAIPGQYKDEEIAVYRIGPKGLWRPCLQALGKVYDRFRPIRPLFAKLLDAAIAPQLESIVSDFQPDILHAVHVGLVYSSETAYRAAHRFGIPFVWTPFPHIEGDTGWRGTRFRRLYGASDAIIAMTYREKRWLVDQGALAERVHVIPAGPITDQQHDAEGFRREYNLGHDPVVLFLGQKLPYKGYRQMVEAAPAVWAKVPGARFVFVGPRTPDSESCFSKIRDERIVELGAVDSFAKNSALAACDIFCMPSTQESLGVVYLEAWCFRKPVIAANIGVAREVIDEGKNGLLVEQAPRAIAEAILRLLENQSTMVRMGEAGYQKVVNEYNWEHITGEVEGLYLELAGHNI